MRFKAIKVFTLAFAWAAPFLNLVADEAAAAAEAPAEDPVLEGEIAYVEQLVNNGYPDIAAPVIEATKKKWPASEVRFFAIEIRGMLALGQFEQAEKKIAALPDRKGTKYWAARLEVANNYFGRGQKDECMKIYDEFFKVFQKPPAEIRKFYLEACYAYGQLLIGNNQYAKAAERYEDLLKMVKDDEWCNLACETADIYLKLIETAKDKSAQEKYVKAATVIVDKLLWQLERPVFFGRAVSMKAHVEQLKGDVEKASAIIDEYRPQLEELHEQILQYDPEGKQGLLRQSPLPECLYLQAKMLWDAAQAEYKQPKRDDEKVKSYMFGPKKEGRRQVEKGAFAMAQGVFLNYETSSWAPQAGDLAQEIRDFAEEKYKAKIKTKITPEQIAKVRAAQFRDANEKFMTGQMKEAVAAYYAVLAKYPEAPESIAAVENIASAMLDLYMEEKDEKEKEALRLDVDTVESYLCERFCDAKDKLVMTAAGDAVIRLAAKEKEYKQGARADELYTDFCIDFRRHAAAATLAAGKAMEFQKAERYEDAIKYWEIVERCYSNTTHYAAALAQQSYCWGKLGDSAKEIAFINRYLPIEQVKIRRLQAQMQLADMYKKDGLRIIDDSATNGVPETAEAEEKRGTAQIIRAIKNFTGFVKEADAALKDPATIAEDKAKYAKLREGALFMIGECWGRMRRPEKNLKMYRERAAQGYADYLEQYPDGQWSKAGYVKLGTIYTALGDMQKSKEALDKLSKQFPDSDEAKNAKPRLAKNLIEMGLKKEGTELYGEMLRTDGAYSARQYLDAGEALIEAKSWDLANQAYEKAIRLAGTNSVITVAKARLGIAKTSWKQGSLPEAREALDQFLADPKMAKMAIAADANFMLVDVASDQGRVEKDTALRTKYFNAAIGALKKVRQYWAKRPEWERNQLDLISGDVLVDRMKAEEAMGLKDEAKDTCGLAAGKFITFLQAHGANDQHPLDKMEPGDVANIERAYATGVPLLAKAGPDKADLVIQYGNEYLNLFPNGKARTVIANAINQAKADLPAGGAKPSAPAATKPEVEAESDAPDASADEAGAE